MGSWNLEIVELVMRDEVCDDTVAKEKEIGKRMIREEEGERRKFISIAYL